MQFPLTITTLGDADGQSQAVAIMAEAELGPLRDRALVAVMAFTFARVSAVVGLKVEDYYPQKKRWWLRLREKNGKVNEMPCHHKLEAYLDVYLSAAGLKEDRKGCSSGLPSGAPAGSPRGPSPASMSGTWCSGELARPA